jgi:N-acetylglucosamine-6-phosphate deacetylase
MKIVNGLVFHEDKGFVMEDLSVKKGKIVSVSPDDDTFDAKGYYVIPGLVDVHFHGAMGYDMCDGTPEALDAIATYELSQGITSICPATMTLAKSTLISICKNAADWAAKNADAPDKARLVGIHLEGPFLSSEKIGAQNPNFLAAPDIDFLKDLQEASGGLVRILSMAPDRPGALDFISQVRQNELFSDVNISLAHTGANYETSLAAFQAGANHVTHMYNAMPPFNHRDPGVIGAAYDTPGCFAELIVDGVHIHDAVVRATFSMFGRRRMLLISDSMRAVGLSDGSYDLGGQEVTVKGNLATLTQGGAIAGSVTNLMDCVRNAVSMGIPLEYAIRCATVNPARSIGMDKVIGGLELGMTADIVILDKDLNLIKVIKDGNLSQ